MMIVKNFLPRHCLKAVLLMFPLVAFGQDVVETTDVGETDEVEKVENESPQNDHARPSWATDRPERPKTLIRPGFERSKPEFKTERPQDLWGTPLGGETESLEGEAIDDDLGNEQQNVKGVIQNSELGYESTVEPVSEIGETSIIVDQANPDVKVEGDIEEEESPVITQAKIESPPEPLNIAPPQSELAALNQNTNQESGDLLSTVKLIFSSMALPEYPRNAFRAKTEGWVEVEFSVSPVGKLKNVKVVSSDPARVFDRAALKALRKWRVKTKSIAGLDPEARFKRRILFKL